MKLDQHDINDIRKDSLKPLPSSKAIFDQLNKLVESRMIAWSQMRFVPKLRNVFSKAKRGEMEGTKKQLLTMETFSKN